MYIFFKISGNYSVYGFEIRLTRSLGPFVLSVYLPSAMFVTMSWVSFLIPPVISPVVSLTVHTLEGCMQLVIIKLFDQFEL